MKATREEIIAERLSIAGMPLEDVLKSEAYFLPETELEVSSEPNRFHVALKCRGSYVLGPFTVLWDELEMRKWHNEKTDDLMLKDVENACIQFMMSVLQRGVFAAKEQCYKAKASMQE